MKKIVPLILIGSFLFSCGEAPENKNNQNSDQLKSQSAEPTKTNASADYSSLLTNYSCDMDIAEVAKALGVPESAIDIPEYAKTPSFTKSGMCYFTIKGFGQDSDGGDTQINWKSEDGMSKADVKREIESYLKNQKEMPESAKKMTGMSIQMADTKDTYLAFQSKTGRIIILNENYGAMLLTYGTIRNGANRTSEQQEELKGKMTQLANYLLKKHRK